VAERWVCPKCGDMIVACTTCSEIICAQTVSKSGIFVSNLICANRYK
jgi:predicted RNA-binding Zn-ribbon protein involved in translation (DUF1610 family)